MKKLTSAIIALALAGSAQADAYKIQVTRKSQDLYQVGYQSNGPVIMTRYCYEYAYSEDSVLTWDGTQGKLIFLNTNQTCDVVRILR